MLPLTPVSNHSPSAVSISNIKFPSPMCILQWNIQGLYAHLEKLQLLMSQDNPSVMCLQETHFKNKHCYNHKKYLCYYKNRENPTIASGGVAIYVERSYVSAEIPITTNLEAVAVSVNFRRKITICNIYIPHAKEINTTELLQLVKQLPKPCLILGDFNSHNTMWGSKVTSSAGKRIESLIEECHLVILNTGKPTRFNAANGSFSTIDLSLCDPTLAPYFQWSPYDYLFGSDHYPLKIQCELELLPHSHKPPELSFQWNIKRANWEGFAADIEINCQAINYEFKNLTTYNIDSTVKKFNDVILTAAHKHIGKANPLTRHLPVPWWNKTCEDAIKESKRALYRLRRHRTETNLIEFKRLRARARYTIKESKRKSWAEYISTLSSNTPISEVWQKIKRIKGINADRNITHLKKNDMVIITKEHIADIFANTYQEASSDLNHSATFLRFKNSKEAEDPVETNSISSEDLPINHHFQMSEINEALTACKNSAPGPDAIPFLFLKNLPISAKELMLKIFNIIWTSHQFPKLWSLAIVFPVRKPGKPAENSTSYRPIALTCCTCKLLERMINKRLVWCLENRGLLEKFQSGFRKARSTTDCIVSLESDIHDAFADNQKLLCVFFDIKRAYDMVWHYQILQTLREWGFKGNVLAFISNFMDHRRIRVRVNEHLSEEKILTNGVPQGSVLSVTLFLIAMNKIFADIRSPVKGSLYADDVVLYTRGKNIKTTSRLLQKAINSLEKWSAKTGFSFSPEKTKCICFSKKGSSALPPLTLNGRTIQYVEEIKYLGVIFDCQLTWKQHVNYLQQNCSQSINLLKTLANQKWGADSNLLLRLYRTLIRSKLDYGAIAYSTGSSALLKRIDTVQNTALRLSMGAFCTSPTESLHTLACEPRLELRRKYLALSYAARVANNPSNPHNSVVFSRDHPSIHDRKPHIVPNFSVRLSRILRDDFNMTFPNLFADKIFSDPPPWTSKVPPVDTGLSRLNKRVHPPELIRRDFDQLRTKYLGSAELYTDASKSAHGVGAGVSTANSGHMFKLPEHSSILTGELYAIYQACKLTTESSASKFIIYSDSLNALNAINRTFPENPIARMIRQHIDTQNTRGRIVSLAYVPSHVGIKGNEEADNLAKMSLSSQESITVSCFLQPDLKKYFKSLILKLWQNTWSRSSSHLRDIKPYVEEPTRTLQHRRSQIVLARLRIGHTRLTHQHLLSNSAAPVCQNCNTQMTVKHLLIECANYHKDRLRYGLPNNIVSMLSNEETLTNLMEFLKSTNLFFLL